jgi:uncharacterized protein YeaO (DUF488 family)
MERHPHDILIEKVSELKTRFAKFTAKFHKELTTEDNQDAVQDVRDALDAIEQALIHIDL